MLRGRFHLCQYMPPKRDARRLVADPDNEPDFYRISETFPVDEETPLAPNTPSANTTASIPNSVVSIDSGSSTLSKSTLSSEAPCQFDSLLRMLLQKSQEQQVSAPSTQTPVSSVPNLLQNTLLQQPQAPSMQSDALLKLLLPLLLQKQAIYQQQVPVAQPPPPATNNFQAQSSLEWALLQLLVSPPPPPPQENAVPPPQPQPDLASAAITALLLNQLLGKQTS